MNGFIELLNICIKPSGLHLHKQLNENVFICFKHDTKLYVGA